MAGLDLQRDETQRHQEVESVFTGRVSVRSEQRGGMTEACVVDRKQGGFDGDTGDEKLHENQLIIVQDEWEATQGAPRVCHHHSVSKL